MKFDTTAVIIAGGKSSRMKQDKALLPFGGFSSLAEFQYRRLDKIFSTVYISSKSNKFDFKVNLIEDTSEVSSPLVALISIFETLDIEEVFVLSVDAPFVDISVIEKLFNKSKETKSDIIIAESKYGLEPLCAIYRRSFFKEAKLALSKDNHRLHSLFEVLTIEIVSVENEKLFMNLNYPKEYEDAQKVFKQM